MSAMVDVFAARKLESMLRTKVEWRDFKRNTASAANSSHFEEYLRFIALKAAFRDFDAKELSPSPEVDQIWHQHILFTKHYAEMCETTLGCSFIHHNPLGALDGWEKQKRRIFTASLYKFIWKDASTFESCISRQTSSSSSSKKRKGSPTDVGNQGGPPIRRRTTGVTSEDEDEDDAEEKEKKAGFVRGKTRVRVKYRDSWYEGTFVKYDHTRRRWIVQCDQDPKGKFTNARLKDIRKITGSTSRPPTVNTSSPVISTYTCKQLKVELRKRNLRVSGKKAELVTRLQNAMSQDNNINSSAPSRASPASAPSIDTYTCKQLKIELRKRKLRVSGKKAELVDRLRKAMDSATSTGRITIRVKDQGGEEISFKIKRSTKMERVFKHYAQRKGVTIRNLRFFLDGQRIASGDTASSLEMEDQDQIDVMLEQTGC